MCPRRCGAPPCCSFVQALAKNGVSARPGVSFGNMAIAPSPAAAAAPAGSGLSETGKIVTGVLVGAGGLVLVALALWCCQTQRKKKQQQGMDHTDADALNKAAFGGAAHHGDTGRGDAWDSRKSKGDDGTGVQGRCVERQGLGPGVMLARAVLPQHQLFAGDRARRTSRSTQEGRAAQAWLRCCCAPGLVSMLTPQTMLP